MADRTVQLATVLGVAGMGKSRLTAQFLASLDKEQVLVLRGRCVSYGEGVTFWPLVEVVRQATGLSGAEPEQVARAALRRLLGDAPDAAEVTERLAPVAGLGGVPGGLEDTAWALRRLLEQLSRDLPVVLVVDDLHWAEPGLVVLVEEICQWLLDSPVMVLVLARPEFLDDHPQWGAGHANAVSALLEPLAGSDMEALIAGVLGGVLPAEVLGRVGELAGGNPLYVEHLLAMLVEDGVLVARENGWEATGDVGQIVVPPSITALIAARLDRLTPEERAVLGPASVIGQVFYPAAVSQLSPVESVSRQLSKLVRKGLIRPGRSELPGQDALRFGHVLVREAAYAMLPKAMRADLHERFARWLDKVGTGSSVDDFVGAHLEAAYLARAELGALDRAARDLGLEASRRLQAAGQKLLFADDGAATALLERADRLRDDHSPERWDLWLDLAYTWWINGARLAEAERFAVRLREDAAAQVAPGWARKARLMLALLDVEMAVEGATEELRAAASESLTFFAEQGDNRGLSLAHVALFQVGLMSYDIKGMAKHFSSAASYSEKAGRHAEAALLRDSYVSTILAGDIDAESGLQEARQVLERMVGRQYRSITASIVSALAGLLGRDSDSDEAWALAQQLARDLPASTVENTVNSFRSDLLLAVGAWTEAAQLLESISTHLKRAESWAVLSTVAAHRAVALLHTGDVETARRELTTAWEHAVAGDVATHATARAAESWLAAIDGDRPAALEHATVATGLLPQEVLLGRALIHDACAEAMLVLGDTEEATLHRRAAIELHDRKGNLVGAAHHRALLHAAESGRVAGKSVT